MPSKVVQVRCSFLRLRFGELRAGCDGIARHEFEQFGCSRRWSQDGRFVLRGAGLGGMVVFHITSKDCIATALHRLSTASGKAPPACEPVKQCMAEAARKATSRSSFENYIELKAIGFF